MDGGARKSPKHARIPVVFGRQLAAVVVLVGSLTACSSDGEPGPSQSSSTEATATATASVQPSPTKIESATATAAKRVYLSFITASYAAERRPKVTALLDRVAELSIDPALGDIQKSVLGLAYDGLGYRGTPPTSRLKTLRDVQPGEQRPQVRLVDCPTVAPTWVPVSIKTGKPAELVKSKIPPPYSLTVVVSKLKGRWVVDTIASDRGKTCTA